MKYMGRISVLFAAFTVAFAEDAKKEFEEMMGSCAPIQPKVHDPLRCREGKGTEFEFDDDCCSGVDGTEHHGLCANSFKRTETTVCAKDHEWCMKNGCKNYKCEKSSACVKYEGCYKDKIGARDLPFKAAIRFDPGETPKEYYLLINVSTCANACRSRNFTFAALQGAGTCFCGDSYGKYGRADERFCGYKKEKAIALRCGDGDEETCAGINAVYRLTGEEKCCDYRQEEHKGPAPGLTYWFYIVLGPAIAVGCIVFCLFLHGGIGLCIFFSIQKRKKERQRQNEEQELQRTQAAQANNASVLAPCAVTVQPQPVTVAAASVTVVDPAKQKADL